LERLFEKHEIAKSPLIKQKIKVFQRKQELTAKIKSIKKTLRSSTTLAFKDELKARKSFFGARVMKFVKYLCSFYGFIYTCFFLSNNFSIPIERVGGL
jgi:hypothetical protein